MDTTVFLTSLTDRPFSNLQSNVIFTRKTNVASSPIFSNPIPFKEKYNFNFLIVFSSLLKKTHKY